MEETRCTECESKRFQCFICKKVDDDTKKALKASTKKKKSTPPSQSQVKQDHFLQIMRKQFLISDIDRDGDCCFNAFSAGYWRVAGAKLSQKELRQQVSQFLLRSDGQVPGLLYQQFEKLADGTIMSCRSAELQNYRNSRIKAPMTLQQYCAKVEKDLYGGDLERGGAAAGAAAAGAAAAGAAVAEAAAAEAAAAGAAAAGAAAAGAAAAGDSGGRSSGGGIILPRLRTRTSSLSKILRHRNRRRPTRPQLEILYPKSFGGRRGATFYLAKI
jgi:hypothetical protein